jgi:nitrate reductase gamma subunit
LDWLNLLCDRICTLPYQVVTPCHLYTWTESSIEQVTQVFLAYGSFIQHYVVLFAMHQMSMGLYRFLAAVGRTQVMANMLGTAALIAIYILGGFVISKG